MPVLPTCCVLFPLGIHTQCTMAMCMHACILYKTLPGIDGLTRCHDPCTGRFMLGSYSTVENEVTNVPTEVKSGGHSFSALCSGHSYICALRPDGRAYCFGKLVWLLLWMECLGSVLPTQKPPSWQPPQLELHPLNPLTRVAQCRKQ